MLEFGIPIRAFTDVVRTIEDGFARGRQQRLNEKERPLQVDRERTIETCFIPLLDRTEVADAGVEDSNIERFKGIANCFRDSPLARDVTGIRADRQHIAFELRLGLFKVSRIIAGNRNACAFADKSAGGCQCRLCRR
jgi:hypothetical protein